MLLKFLCESTRMALSVARIARGLCCLLCYSLLCLQEDDRKASQYNRACMYVCMYEGVSKSPRTMLITRKSLVVDEFPARVCCDGVRQFWSQVQVQYSLSCIGRTKFSRTAVSLNLKPSSYSNSLAKMHILILPQWR